MIRAYYWFSVCREMESDLPHHLQKEMTFQFTPLSIAKAQNVLSGLPLGGVAGKREYPLKKELLDRVEQIGMELNCDLSPLEKSLEVQKRYAAMVRGLPGLKKIYHFRQVYSMADADTLKATLVVVQEAFGPTLWQGNSEVQSEVKAFTYEDPVL
jgi:hypothetical protein